MWRVRVPLPNPSRSRHSNAPLFERHAVEALHAKRMLVRIQPPRRPRRSQTGKGVSFERKFNPRRLPHSGAHPFQRVPPTKPNTQNKIGSTPVPSTCGWAAFGRHFPRKGKVSPWLVHSDARRFNTRETTRFNAPRRPNQTRHNELVRFQHPQPCCGSPLEAVSLIRKNHGLVTRARPNFSPHDRARLPALVRA